MEGFTDQRIDVGPVRIAASVGGSGPPLLLLHGYPQHRAMWRHVAPALAAHHTVVATDLRGYGQSSKPPGDEAHRAYSKRAMAAEPGRRDEHAGFERFAVCGHDRGARVAHRICLDHPDAVAAAAVLDIVPTLHLFETGRPRVRERLLPLVLPQPARRPA